MSDQDKLLEWAEEQVYSPEVCHHMNTLDKRVIGHCACEWVSPYGFVPEAGCPEHDINKQGI